MQSTNTFRLLNDAGTQYIDGTPGSAVTLQNSQCGVNLAGTTVSSSGTTFTLTLPLSFKSAYAGSKNIYVDAVGATGSASGWQTRGTWTVVTPVMTADSVTPSSGSGNTQTFTLKYSDTAGAGDITTAWAWFNASFSGGGGNSCFFYYISSTNTLRLLNDAGTLYFDGTPGSSTTLQNSQCGLSLSGTTVASSGATLTLTVPMVLKPAFAGTKNIYMDAVSASGQTSGWPARGTWTAHMPVMTADSVTPSGGSTASQTFTLQYSDSFGHQDIDTAWVWFNASFSGGANSCFLYYIKSSNTMRLLNDAASLYVDGTPGGSGTLQNSQCSLNLGSSSVAASGTTLTLTLAMTFKPAFAGAKNIYMDVVSTSGQTSGWPAKGTWVVPGVTVTADGVSPSSGAGSAQMFSLQYSDTYGAADLSQVWAWFTPVFVDGSKTGGQLSCMVYYDRSQSKVFLLDDSGQVWNGATLPTSTTLQNSQCAVALGSSSFTTNGNTLTLNLAISFTAKFGGTKSIYMWATNATGTASGWQAKGTWTVPGSGVTVDSATPNSGSGLTQSFSFQYTNSTGGTAFSTVWAWFSPTFIDYLPSSGGQLSCMVYYDQPQNKVFLLDDQGTHWNGATPGGAGSLQNSRCSIALSGVSVVPNGNVLTMTLPVTFVPQFGGLKNIYQYAANTSGAVSGWQARGTWTVPGTGVTADSVTPTRSTGASQTFSFQYSAASGGDSFTTVWAWFNPLFIDGDPVGGQLSCMVYYNKALNKLWLLDDAGQQWNGATPGSNTTLENRQCKLAVSTAAVVISGNTLTMNLPLTFTEQFGGVKSIYMDGVVTATETSGWQPRGVWEVPGTGITSEPVSADGGTGTTRTFTLTYTDTAGATDLSTAWVWFNDRFSPSAANSCMLYWDVATQKLNLIRDDGQTWMSASVGNGILQNRSCSIALTGTTVGTSGNVMTITLPVTFSTDFSGTKNIYLDGVGHGVEGGWRPRGKWTVPSSSVTLNPGSTPPFYAGLPVTWAANAGGTAGPFSYKWWVFDGTAWTVQTGWTPTNTFTWTPPAEGTYSIAAWVRSAGNSDDAPDGYIATAVSISPAAPIVVTGPAGRTDHEQDFVNARITATDPLGMALSYSATGLPPEISVNTITGDLVGVLTAESAGVYTVIVRAAAGTRVAERSFEWFVMCPAQDYQVSPLGKTVGPGSIGFPVTVTTSSGCPWRVVPQGGVDVDPDDRQSTYWGSDTIYMIGGNNPSNTPQLATVRVADQRIQIVQGGQAGTNCEVAGNPNQGSLTFAAGGGYADLPFSLGYGNCPWIASTNRSWIQLNKTSGVGSDTIRVTVSSPNPGTQTRSGKVVVNGTEFDVYQIVEACGFTLSLETPEVTFPADAPQLARDVTVNAPNGCGWSADDDAGWISITQPSNPVGVDRFTIHVENNPQPTYRSGTVTVTHGSIQQKVTVIQLGVGGVPSFQEGEISYFHTDAIGSVRMISNASGAVVQHYDYLPFGQEVGTGSSDSNVVRFAGKERDRETALNANWGPLDYSNARYYQNQLGRFASVDPWHMGGDLLDPQGWNGYAYARNNPLHFVDPTGNSCVKQAGAGANGEEVVTDNGDGKRCKELDAAVVVRGRMPTPPFLMAVAQGAVAVKPVVDTIAVATGIVAGGVTAAGWATLGGTEATIVAVSRFTPLAPLIPPAGQKMAQIISRLGVGRGDPQAAMQALTRLRDAAVQGGTYVQANYIQTGTTIYRFGQEYLTVSAEGKVLSYVPAAESGWGVVSAYIAAGGR